MEGHYLCIIHRYFFKNFTVVCVCVFCDQICEIMDIRNWMFALNNIK